MAPRTMLRIRHSGTSGAAVLTVRTQQHPSRAEQVYSVIHAALWAELVALEEILNRPTIWYLPPGLEVEVYINQTVTL